MKTFSTSQVGSLIYNFRLEKKKFIYLFPLYFTLAVFKYQWNEKSHK